jgi:hypothetical protein
MSARFMLLRRVDKPLPYDWTVRLAAIAAAAELIKPARRGNQTTIGIRSKGALADASAVWRHLSPNAPRREKARVRSSCRRFLSHRDAG